MHQLRQSLGKNILERHYTDCKVMQSFEAYTYFSTIVEIKKHFGSLHVPLLYS